MEIAGCCTERHAQWTARVSNHVWPSGREGCTHYRKQCRDPVARSRYVPYLHGGASTKVCLSHCLCRARQTLQPEYCLHDAHPRPDFFTTAVNASLYKLVAILVVSYYSMLLAWSTTYYIIWRYGVAKAAAMQAEAGALVHANACTAKQHVS